MNVYYGNRVIAVKPNFKMAPAAILDFLEMKFDVSGSCDRPLSTSVTNWSFRQRNFGAVGEIEITFSL